MTLPTRRKTANKRKLQDVMKLPYKNVIPLNPTNEHRFLVTSTKSLPSHTSLKMVAQRSSNNNNKNKHLVKASGITLPDTSLLELVVPFSQQKQINEANVNKHLDPEDMMLCSKIDSSSNTGNKKRGKVTAFRGRQGSQAKVDKTWLLQTKYIMNDLYASTSQTPGSHDSNANGKHSSSNENVNIQSQINATFVKVVAKTHPSKRNVTAVSTSEFLPFHAMEELYFHQVQHINPNKKAKLTILRNCIDDDDGDDISDKNALKLNVVLPNGDFNDSNSVSKENFENDHTVKLTKNTKYLDRITYASFMKGGSFYYVPVQHAVSLEPTKSFQTGGTRIVVNRVEDD
jgi:hypothetical protein